jgi:hypothetical protein
VSFLARLRDLNGKDVTTGRTVQSKPGKPGHGGKNKKPKGRPTVPPRINPQDVLAETNFARSNLDDLLGSSEMDGNLGNFKDQSQDLMAEESIQMQQSNIHHQVKPLGPHQQTHDPKNVNYWPQKLNSYYGDEFTHQYMNQLKFQEPIVEIPNHNHNQVTMTDRISAFYTDYKLLAWTGIVILIALSLLSALLVLYWKNPPTEVVTARTNLAKKLSDPIVLGMITAALKKWES